MLFKAAFDSPFPDTKNL